MLSIIKVIYSSCLLQMKQSFGRPTFQFTILVQPIIYGLITYEMFKNSGQQNFMAYAVLGTGILTIWSSICFSSAGDIERERFMGTLEIIFSVPVKFELIIFGKVIGNTVLGISSMLITFIFLTVAFGVHITIQQPIIFFATLLLALVSFAGIAMLLATAFTLSRGARILMNVLEYPVFILCGVLFPIEILPVWTRPLSYILSPTWAVKLLKMSVLGIDNYTEFTGYLIILALITVVYYLLALFLFRIVDKQTRIKATLGVS